MTENRTPRIYLSHDPLDTEAAAILCTEFAKANLPSYLEKNQPPLGQGWLDHISGQIEACTAFVLLIGHEGVHQWQLVEMQLALAQYLLPHAHSQWLPLYVMLLPDAWPGQIPPILSQFPALKWRIDNPIPRSLIAAIQAHRPLSHNEQLTSHCPYVGLDSFQKTQAPLFFGRRRETLDIIRYFGTQSQAAPSQIKKGGEQYCRWLQIEGRTVTGKSSLINAGLIPLIEQGALWPRTGFTEWKILGPIVPNDMPLLQLAEVVESTLEDEPDIANIQAFHKQLLSDDTGLYERLKAFKSNQVGFILIVDQFEELFTVSQKNEQRRFDAQLASALLAENSCFFLMTAISTGYLEGFERLLYLSEWYNTRCKRYNLSGLSPYALREIIELPAQLNELDVKEVLPTLMDDAEQETRVLPFVENALQFLWHQRQLNKLSLSIYQEHGGIAGILEKQADELLDHLEQEMPGSKADALKLLLALTEVHVDGRHTRQRIPLDQARDIAGNHDSQRGQKVIDILSGKVRHRHHTGLKLIDIIGGDNETNHYYLPLHKYQFVELLFEPLVHPRSYDGKTGQAIGYWQTLYHYISENHHQDISQHTLLIRAKAWDKSRGWKRWWYLASWPEFKVYRKLKLNQPNASVDKFLYWSKIALSLKATLTALALAFVGQSLYWTHKNNLPLSYILTQQKFRLIDAGMLPMPIPEMATIDVENNDFSNVEPDISFLETGEPVFDTPKFATPGTDVALAPRFFLSKHEITYEQYDYYVWTQNGKIDYPMTAKGGRDQHPVVNVSWFEANNYLAWLSKTTKQHYRLPTEAEWQYADRAQSNTDFWWGDGIGKNRANCTDCGSTWDGKQSAPVGSFKANSFGLYDTVGNVYEWTCSAWKEQSTGTQYTCGTPSDALRVFMGGSWRNRSIFLLYSSKDWDVMTYSSDNLGFRAARIE